MIIGYAFIEAFNPHRDVGNLLVENLHLTGSTAQIVKDTGAGRVRRHHRLVLGLDRRRDGRLVGAQGRTRRCRRDGGTQPTSARHERPGRHRCRPAGWTVGSAHKDDAQSCTRIDNDRSQSANAARADWRRAMSDSLDVIRALYSCRSACPG
jgi:hypothetical protein